MQGGVATSMASPQQRSPLGATGALYNVWLVGFGVLACASTPFLALLALALGAVKSIQACVATWLGIVLPLPQQPLGTPHGRRGQGAAPAQ